VEIATYVKTPVPAIEVDTKAEEDLKTAPLVVVDESGKTSELAATKPEPVLQAEPVQTAAALTPTSVEPEQTLPETASAMPLLGLIGMLSLAAFAALRIRSRRIL
jgi:hypothetical protein